MKRAGGCASFGRNPNPMHLARPCLFALALALCGAVLPAVATSDRLVPDDYLNLLRIDLRAAKSSVVTEALELTAEEARGFLPLYHEYDKTLAKLNTRRINQLREFAATYATIDDAGARAHTRLAFDFLHRRLDLLEKTTRRIERAVSPVVAARFAQIEEQLLMLIDVQLASELPLIPRDAVLPPE